MRVYLHSLVAAIMITKKDIELFWENTATKERKTEGIIPPRGGFLDVNTFVGHGMCIDFICCFIYIVVVLINECIFFIPVLLLIRVQL